MTTLFRVRLRSLLYSKATLTSRCALVKHHPMWVAALGGRQPRLWGLFMVGFMGRLYGREYRVGGLGGVYPPVQCPLLSWFYVMRVRGSIAPALLPLL